MLEHTLPGKSFFTEQCFPNFASKPFTAKRAKDLQRKFENFANNLPSNRAFANQHLRIWGALKQGLTELTLWRIRENFPGAVLMQESASVMLEHNLSANWKHTLSWLLDSEEGCRLDDETLYLLCLINADVEDLLTLSELPKDYLYRMLQTPEE